MESIYRMNFVGLTYRQALDKLTTLPFNGVERITSVDNLGFNITNENNPQRINFDLRSPNEFLWSDQTHANSYARSHPESMVVESFYWG